MHLILALSISHETFEIILRNVVLSCPFWLRQNQPPAKISEAEALYDSNNINRCLYLKLYEFLFLTRRNQQKPTHLAVSRQHQSK